MKPRIALLVVGAAISGCSQSDDSRAMQALGKADMECLREAHWKPATRTGAYQQIGTGDGAYFLATDRPISKGADVDSYRFGVWATGRAERLNHLERFEDDYLKAGSPEHVVPNGFDGDIDRRMYVNERDDTIHSVRGVATGWLSVEDYLPCPKDQHTGRWFIITDFQPGFPVKGV